MFFGIAFCAEMFFYQTFSGISYARNKLAGVFTRVLCFLMKISPLLFYFLNCSCTIFREVLCLEFLYCRVVTGSADGKVSCQILLNFEN